MSSPVSTGELSNVGESEDGSPGLLSPAQTEVTNGDAESVSPRSSVGSEQSLTTQLLLGHRPNQFTKTSLSANSPSASLTASPVHGHPPSPKSSEEPQPGSTSDIPDSAAGAAYTASAVMSPSTLQHTPGHQDHDPSMPDLSPHPTLHAVPDPIATAPEQPQLPGTSDESARQSTSPVKGSSPLSIPSQLSSIRTPTPPASSSPEGATTAGFIHSNSTDRLFNAPQASMDPSSIPQLESLHPASCTPNVALSESALSHGCAMPAAPTSAQMEAGVSSDADATDLSNLHDRHHFMSDLVSGPASSSANATLISDRASSSGDDIFVSEPASSPTRAKESKAGTPKSSHEPHATSGAAGPSVTVSAPLEMPSTSSPQLTLSNEAGSPGTAVAGTSHDAYIETGMAGSCSPQAEHPEADAGSDAVPRPSTARSDSPQAEQTEAGIGTDTVPGPITAGVDSPQAEQTEADAGTDAVPGPITASSDSPQAEHPEADAGTDAVPGPSTANPDSPHTERQNSSAAASTSEAEEAAPRTHGHAHRLDAHKGGGQGGVTHAWKQHPKHVLILSNAGKPIWSLHGDENALAGLTAVIQALVSFVHDKGDCMQSIRAGKHLIVFLEKGPFILVMASTTKEPESALLGQLGLVHGQILSILTSSVEKMFAKNPSYDVRKLLGATNHVLTSLVASFDREPSALLTSLVPLPLRSNLRHYALLSLQAAVKSAGALFGVLLTQTAIVAVAHQSRAHVMHQHDLLLLANLVRSNESFRQAETFTPVCLPHFNPTAFLHAYVQYLHEASGLCLVLLSPHPESFFKLAEAAQEIRRQLKQPGVSQAVISTVENQAGEGLLNIANLPAPCGGGEAGTTPLLHFLYKSPMRAQVIMPAFAPPLDTPGLRQAAMQRYAVVHDAMFHRPARSVSSNQRSLSPIPPSQSLQAAPLQQQVHWCTDGSLATLAYAGPEYELYALFDAMTEKLMATQICHRLSVWIKGQQADLFMQR
ncbi:hypothetical protein ABBQ38_005698 [Trebouxia sp. C0009 RCD-2024]